MLTSALQAKTTPILMVLQILVYTVKVVCYRMSSLSSLQYLGYLDLYLLSIHSAQRRKKVYSLDQSGQPKVWNIVHTECLLLINSMTTRLTNKKLTNGIAGPGAAAAAGNDGSSIIVGDQTSQSQSKHQKRLRIIMKTN